MGLGVVRQKAFLGAEAAGAKAGKQQRRPGAWPQVLRGRSLRAGARAERLGWGTASLPPAPGRSCRLPSSHAPPPGPLGSRLFMEEAGSPSSSGKPPRPVLPWEAGPRQGAPSSAQGFGGLAPDRVPPPLHRAAGAGMANVPGARQHLPSNAFPLSCPALSWKQRWEEGSCPSVRLRLSLPSICPRRAGPEDEAEPLALASVLPPCGELGGSWGRWVPSPLRRNPMPVGAAPSAVGASALGMCWSRSGAGGGPWSFLCE